MAAWYKPVESGGYLSENVQTNGIKAVQALELVKRLAAQEEIFIELPSEERKAKRAEQTKPIEMKDVVRT